jgi:chaperonin GroEL (HSP60 family)
VRVDLTAVSPSQEESDSALASVVDGDHSGCTTPHAAIPPHRRMQQQDDASLEVCNARIWLLEAQLEAKEQELNRLKQELRDAQPRGGN